MSAQANSVPEAFILVKTEPSHERDVYLALTSHDAVKEVHALYGEFDLLAHVSSESAKTLTTLLMKEFRTIEGIRDTQTLIAVEY
ncbi:MAG: AsnC family transcriptional regulator [Rhodobiaceae bacterium]|nr:AsnC family transcriptional regulator [Rhodobiaceae bacterium]